ncbi:MAG: endonuclease/exonuclease/phosphatase family protein [Burkholderiales bacterium]|nr:endonuclease/exonuclease/phosphatase family protein [Ferrovum sp.]
MAHSHKILLSNLGYARGISGKFSHHVRYLHRHFYCSPAVQKRALGQLSTLITREDPDLCCFVEIDKGSFTSAGYNQLHALINAKYPHSDIENKYGPTSHLRTFFVTRGKSNGFMAKQNFPYERIYFRHGTKRLVYKIALSPHLSLFFSHLSLNKSVRRAQLLEVRELMTNVSGEAVFLGDFNILSGVAELTPLLECSGIVLLNQEDEPTFTFHKRRLLLDLCFCSAGIAVSSRLTVVPQVYSDHAALVLEITVPDQS